MLRHFSPKTLVKIRENQLRINDNLKTDRAFNYTTQVPPRVGEGASGRPCRTLLSLHLPLHKGIRFVDIVPACPCYSHLRRMKITRSHYQK
jgi:hypothetical protein